MSYFILGIGIGLGVAVIFGDSPDAARGRMRRWFSRAGEAR